MSHTNAINTNINRQNQKSSNAYILGIIGKSPLLPKEEIEKLVMEAKSDNDEAKTLVVGSCIRLVYKLASDCSWSGLSFEDRFQDGVVKLLESIDSYKPDGTASFITYASTCIRYYLIDQAKRNKKHDQTVEFDKDYGSNAKHPFIYDDSKMFMKIWNKIVKEELDTAMLKYPEEERSYLQSYYELNGKKPLSIPRIAQMNNVSKDHVNRVLRKGRERLKNDKQVRDLW